MDTDMARQNACKFVLVLNSQFPDEFELSDVVSALCNSATDREQKPIQAVLNVFNKLFNELLIYLEWSDAEVITARTLK